MMAREHTGLKVSQVNMKGRTFSGTTTLSRPGFFHASKLKLGKRSGVCPHQRETEREREKTAALIVKTTKIILCPSGLLWPGEVKR